MLPTRMLNECMMLHIRVSSSANRDDDRGGDSELRNSVDLWTIATQRAVSLHDFGRDKDRN